MQKSGKDLLALALGKSAASYADELLLSDLREATYARLELGKFKVHNASEFPVTDCHVWFPRRYSEHLKSRVTFFVRAPLRDCSFFFFSLPSRKSKVVFSLKGNGHRATLFSTNEMKFTARMVGSNSRLSIGENCYIGGATIILRGTEVTVGADGLWSDEILLQGSDSHGVVDLDTQMVINDGLTHIKLGRHVWLGRRVTITKNVTINDGSIVAAGSVVTKDVPAASVVAGVPARVMKSRTSWSRRPDEVSPSEATFLANLKIKIDSSKGT